MPMICTRWVVPQAMIKALNKIKTQENGMSFRLVP
jgi:hypothetical protein